MATTTTNNGWDIPQSSDYVKDGAVAIATLGQDIDTSVGTGLLAWQSWAPTLSGGWLNGNGTWTAAYAQLGKTVVVRGNFTVGSTTTKGTQMDISLPVTANVSGLVVCSTRLNTGGQNYVGQLFLQSTTTSRMFTARSDATNAFWGGVTATSPATWATGDIFSFQFTYEAA